MARRERGRIRSRLASLKKPTSWEGWATVIGLPVGAVLGILALVNLGGGDSPPAPSLAQVEPVDLVVHNGGATEAPPRLEILLHNIGDKRAVLSRANIEIRRVGLLRQCFSQGDLPLSTTYAATLPANAAPGHVVQAPLHEQLGGDEADRFAIGLGVRADPAKSSYSMGGKQNLPGLYLFEVAISLISDEGGQPLSVGRALVSLPVAPEPFGFYWDRPTMEQLVQYDREVERNRKAAGDPTSSPPWPPAWTKKCWLANTKTLRGMLAADAERSPTLTAVGNSIITPDVSLLEAPGA